MSFSTTQDPARPAQRRRYKLGIITAIVAALALLLSACASSPATANDAQTSQQEVTDAYMTAAIAAVPYPLASMTSGGWLERTLLKEHLLRQNNAHRRAFVTIMNQMGQPIIQFPIQGMVFDQNSQMTTTDIINRYCRDCTGGGVAVTTPAAGDNGTWGPEPGGVAFFTVSGMEVKWNGLYMETDAPMTLPNKPLLTYDASVKPDTTGGIVSDGNIAAGGKVAKSK